MKALPRMEQVTRDNGWLCLVDVYCSMSPSLPLVQFLWRIQTGTLTHILQVRKTKQTSKLPKIIASWFHNQSSFLKTHQVQKSTLFSPFPEWNPIVKYSTGETAYNGLDMFEFYNTTSYTASFPDDLCGVDPAEKCTRPHKHTLQHELLSENRVKQVKLKLRFFSVCFHTIHSLLFQHN